MNSVPFNKNWNVPGTPDHAGNIADALLNATSSGKPATLKMDDLIKIAEIAMKNRVPVCTVKTKKEAQLLNSQEKIFKKMGITSHKWKIGDRYYKFQWGRALKGIPT